METLALHLDLERSANEPWFLRLSRRSTVRTFALFVTLVCLAASAQATSIFFNGFNFPDTPPAVDVTVFNGGAIGPWTVGGDSVDWIGGYWQPAEGNGSIDVSGNAAGSVSTTLSTVAGQTYYLSFYLAGNPDNGGGIRSVQVQVGDLDQLFTFDSTGYSHASMGWIHVESVAFLAAGNDTLTFTSLDLNQFGAALDGVSVSDTKIPEPATLVLIGSGLIGIGLLRRRH
jgi:choice-of-anchor C domain-containing protein